MGIICKKPIRKFYKPKYVFFFINMFMKEGSSETTREAPFVIIIKHLGEDIVRPGRKLLL